MPELPEVETIRRGLEKKLVGKTISGLEILPPKPARGGGSFIGNPKLIKGKKILSVSRLGKQLSIYLSNKFLLLIHLKMTGQLIFNPPSSRGGRRGLYPNKYTRLIFTFSDKSNLYFNDVRKFGWIRLVKVNDLSNLQKNMGIDLLDKKFTLNYFSSILKNSKKPIKTILLDQSKFAGIGNIYANEALFLAKIYPLKPASEISLLKTKKLYLAILKVIKESIKHGGSTAKDKGYLQSSGEAGTHQNYFRVYQRGGQPCFVCKTPIKRVKTFGRSTFFCLHCQK